jgi:anti-sigma B factor antagonist
VAEAARQIGTLRLDLSGDLDVDTVPAAQDEAMEALSLPWLRTLQLDLGDVTFIGSTGLGMLVELCQVGKAAGIEVSLQRVSAKIYRVMEIAGLADSFVITPSE